MNKNLVLIIVILFFLCCFSACNQTSAPDNTPTQTAAIVQSGQTSSSPTPSFTPLHTRIPSPTPVIPDTGWQVIQAGLEQRQINLIAENNLVQEQIFLFRLDPALFRFQIHTTTEPISLETWLEETGARAVVNGGYFRIEDEKTYPNGLTIINGQIQGFPFGDYAGMFTVTGTQVNLRWLAQQPYSPDENIDYSLQSFPLLVKPNGVLGFPEEYEDNISARRTVLGQDRAGNILLILTNRGYFTLHTLSKYLTESDLNLDIAVNLDGGPSTGFLMNDPDINIPSGTLLPFVISIHPQ